jgi:hypothetical protein
MRRNRSARVACWILHTFILLKRGFLDDRLRANLGNSSKIPTIDLPVQFPSAMAILKKNENIECRHCHGEVNSSKRMPFVIKRRLGKNLALRPCNPSPMGAEWVGSLMESLNAGAKTT